MNTESSENEEHFVCDTVTEFNNLAPKSSIFRIWAWYLKMFVFLV